jgi:DHA1 family bicyclomycin/chloramphenicol resistance-like MFS transporter
MILRPDTLALTAVLALLTSLGPLSTDMYLPSLPAIGQYFGRNIADVQLTLSAFLFGFAAGQVFYGPLADRHGRRPVLLAGLVLFILATIACAFAPTLDVLTTARFAQALGASGPIVLARSIVRDLYAMERAGRELARMGTIMGLVPAIAPILGGLLEVAFGWRASFLATVLFALALLVVVATALPETLKHRAPEAVSMRRILTIFRDIARNEGYRGYVMISACTYGGLFAFISGSSFVLQGIYGLDPRAYGFAFAAAVVGYIAGTIIAQRVVNRRGIEGTIHLGVWLLAVGGLAMLGAMLFGPGHIAEALVPIVIYMVGVGLTFPQSQAGAMTLNAERAGAASSLLGLCQMSFAAAAGILLGLALGASAWPLGAAIALLGCAALLVFVVTRGARNAALAASRAGDQARLAAARSR